MPGQFVMISTRKEKNKFKSKTINSISKVKPNIHNDLQSKQISYLKRPFGIYRTYYENFNEDYLSKLNLEKKLASILYTVKPNRFEIVYKVLERGLGTNEMMHLVRNDKVEILAPLGKVYDFRELLKEELDEIHIVGGGVGIAPLIYLVQVLRSFGIEVKAFIGIEDCKSLIYKDRIKKNYTDTGRNAKIYIDDLKLFGLSGTSDIYVSFMCDTEEEQLKGIKNVFKGSLVTEPYSEYLHKHGHLKTHTFTCGPLPMMQKVHNITAQYNIKSYVLMEKRMACGIGVCFSCVCKTIENGVNHYSRVCMDGPIMESKQINWNE
jgi:dihydroorotate dehydrogenase electron transfer subunit